MRDRKTERQGQTYKDRDTRRYREGYTELERVRGGGGERKKDRQRQRVRNRETQRPTETGTARETM